MALRDPKDVAEDAYRKCASYESVRRDFDEIEDIIRDDRAAVIAEAKRVLTLVSKPSQDTLAALDAILSEKG